MDQQTPWSVDLDTSPKATVVVPEPQQELQWETCIRMTTSGGN